MRIIAGAWRGRTLSAPAGSATRPTADRVRQAAFDMLMHAPWGGRPLLDGALVLDAFAGSGALGLEALSRGAGHATFFDTDRAALKALRHNIAACGAELACTVLPASAAGPPRAPAACQVVFLDPPYGQNLAASGLAALRASGWLAAGSVVVIETARDEAAPPCGEVLAERTHGAARITILRIYGDPGSDSRVNRLETNNPFFDRLTARHAQQDGC